MKQENITIRIQYKIAFLSVVLFLGKLLAYYLTHSVTILTDALESIANVVSGFIGLYSIILAAKPRDRDHPYGHGKAEYVSAAVEGALISIAGLLIIYQAVHQLLEVHQLHKLDIGVMLVCMTGFVNYLMGRYALKAGVKHKSAVVEAAGNHLMSDAYATIGIVIGLLLIIWTKWLWLDSVIALIFAGIIIVTGYKVLRKSLAGIMDEADEKLLKEVIDFLQLHRKPQWVDLHNLRVIQYGDVMHVDTHMTIPWYYLVADAEKEIHELETLIRSHFGDKVEFFIHIDGCMPYQCHLCSLIECPERKFEFKEQVAWNFENVWLNEKHGKIDYSVPS
ncbi:MAG: cation diffusion facilitator family transporter [Flavipsychrobacter sp.]|nr:cation diffusion facilitator family transporter [Flavipsychrobacter sp.]